MKKVLGLLLLVACGDTTNVSEGETNMVYGVDTELGVGLRNPEKGPDGWQQSGTMTTGDAQKTVSMQANFQDAGYYTVQFGLILPSTVSNCNPTAIIDWRVEGSSVRRKVSVGNGVSISGTGQAVAVVVSDETTGTLGNDYVVQVQVSKGTRPNPGYPVTLKGAKTLCAAGATISIAIPENVGVASLELLAEPVAIAGFPITGIVVEFLNGVGSPLKGYTLPEGEQFIAIPPDARSVSVSNLSANAYSISSTWGIDG